MSSQNYLNQPGDLMKVPGNIGNKLSSLLAAEIECSIFEQHVAPILEQHGLMNLQIPLSEPEDFPLGKACDLSGEGGCEACS